MKFRIREQKDTTYRVVNLGEKPTDDIPVLPDGLGTITKPWLIRWAEWVAAGRPEIDRQATNSTVYRLTSAVRNEFNPALHPRDPNTGKFVERSFDLPDDAPNFADMETAEVLSFLDENGEDIDAVLASDNVSIDGVPTDATSLDEFDGNGDASTGGVESGGDIIDEMPDPGSPEFLEWAAESNGWETDVSEDELEVGDEVLYWSGGSANWHAGEVSGFREDPVFDEEFAMVDTGDGEIRTDGANVRLVGRGGGGTPPNPQDVKEQRAVERVDEALDSVEGPASEWLQSEFPRERFDDADEAAEFITTLGDAVNTYDTGKDAIQSMLENTDIHVQRGVANHFGAGAFATIDSNGRAEVVLDPDEGINTTGTVAHELAHALATSNGMGVTGAGSEHSSKWSDNGLVFDSDISEYQFTKGDFGSELTEEFEQLAAAADNAIAKTAEAVKSGEFEDWDDEKIVNGFEYAHTNSSELVSEAVRAMRDERTRQNLRENWPDLYQEVSNFVSV